MVAAESGASEAELVRRAIISAYGTRSLPSTYRPAVPGHEPRKRPFAPAANPPPLYPPPDPTSTTAEYQRLPSAAYAAMRTAPKSKLLTVEQYSAMKPSEQLRALREGRSPAGAISPTEPA